MFHVKHFDGKMLILYKYYYITVDPLELSPVFNDIEHRLNKFNFPKTYDFIAGPRF
ncbi:MAG: hypothetical protein FWG43_06210 [Clostridiales bacterium]|nr:hypothetical protein [Clostridiales bacterium]